jgi:hypothetical protein
MEQANAGNFFGRNHCWLAAVNDRVGLDALASADSGTGFLSYWLGTPKLRAQLG